MTVELLDQRVLAMQRLVSAVASRFPVVRTLSSVEDLVYVGLGLLLTIVAERGFLSY